MVSFEPTQQPCALQLTTLVVRAVDSMGRGTRVGIVGGFMSTDAHFWVKIGQKLQSLGKISNITATDPPPQFFEVNSNTAGDDMSPIFKLGEHDHECSPTFEEKYQLLTETIWDLP